MILITGGTGLLGSQLAFDLVNNAERVRILKRKTSSVELLQNKFKNNPALFNKIEFAVGDVLDIFSIEDALTDITHVYHCAAIVSFVSRDNEMMQQVNTEGTANVVNACLQKEIKKLCHVSSVAALGRTENLSVIDENAIWENSKHNSNYAISKYNAEREVWRGIAEGLNAVIVNPTIILGEGNYKTDSSSLFAKVYSGLNFYSEGVNGFVDVRDVSASMIFLMQSEIKNERFIICSENKSYREVLSRMADVLHVKRPSIKVNAFLSECAWRFEFLKSLITKSKPLVTKETARTALNKHFYLNKKIRSVFNKEFISMNESVQYWGEKFLQSEA